MRLLDISHHQESTRQIDWDKIKDPVIMKATQGTNLLDHEFLENREEARKRGVYKGSYHFAGKGFLDNKNKLYFVAQYPIKEADWYLKNVGEIREGEILCLDWEIEHSDPVEWCLKFLTRIIEKTGLPPERLWFYTNEARVLKYDWTPVAKLTKLWVAKYNSTSECIMVNPPKTGAWDKYEAWQYCSVGRVDGIEGKVDLSETQPIQSKALWHRFAHMDRNFIRRGDLIKKGQKIGTVGDGNGQYYAHLHYDISNKPIEQEYVKGMSKAQVAAQYLNPHTTVNLNEITDNHHLGYDYLSWNGYGYHPGVDINGKGVGNADFGNPIYSPINGVVSYEKRAWFKNGGWGNVIVIKEN